MVLVLLLLAQFALRLHGQSVVEALASTALVGAFMFLARRYGGWSSPGSAWAWLRAHPKSYFLVATGTANIVAVMLYFGQLAAYAFVADVVGGYFFFHSVLAVGVAAYEKVFRVA